MTQNKWSRIAVVVAVIGVLAALLVVPEVRRWLNLERASKIETEQPEQAKIEVLAQKINVELPNFLIT